MFLGNFILKFGFILEWKVTDTRRQLVNAAMKGQFVILVFLAILVLDKTNKKFTPNGNHVSHCTTNALLQLRTLKKTFNQYSFQTGRTYQNRTSLVLLLLLSGDIQLNPGPRPPKFPCGICSKAVKWDYKSPSVCCDYCNIWYHQECMKMPDAVFEGLKNVSWECTKCGVPNFSLSLFDTTIFDSSNSLDLARLQCSWSGKSRKSWYSTT